jgi:hypothetical protein
VPVEHCAGVRIQEHAGGDAGRATGCLVMCLVMCLVDHARCPGLGVRLPGAGLPGSWGGCATRLWRCVVLGQAPIQPSH